MVFCAEATCHVLLVKHEPCSQESIVITAPIHSQAATSSQRNETGLRLHWKPTRTCNSSPLMNKRDEKSRIYLTPFSKTLVLTPYKLGVDACPMNSVPLSERPEFFSAHRRFRVLQAIGLFVTGPDTKMLLGFINILFDYLERASVLIPSTVVVQSPGK